MLIICSNYSLLFSKNRITKIKKIKCANNEAKFDINFDLKLI